MPKVTSKLQVTLPKRIAEQHAIVPGDEIEFISVGDVIHIVPAQASRRGEISTAERLRLFDEASARQQVRARKFALSHRTSPPAQRDWRREDLYTRGNSDQEELEGGEHGRGQPD